MESLHEPSQSGPLRGSLGHAGAHGGRAHMCQAVERSDVALFRKASEVDR